MVFANHIPTYVFADAIAYTSCATTHGYLDELDRGGRQLGGGGRRCSRCTGCRLCRFGGRRRSARGDPKYAELEARRGIPHGLGRASEVGGVSVCRRDSESH